MKKLMSLLVMTFAFTLAFLPAKSNAEPAPPLELVKIQAIGDNPNNLTTVDGTHMTLPFTTNNKMYIKVFFKGQPGSPEILSLGSFKYYEGAYLEKDRLKVYDRRDFGGGIGRIVIYEFDAEQFQRGGNDYKEITFTAKDCRDFLKEKFDRFYVWLK
ncbi:TPA: hypothetical protein ROX88_000241 [Bacillus pseudomycoides]|nr:hypothetical protein [Bacillus pseudomycoides]